MNFIHIKSYKIGFLLIANKGKLTFFVNKHYSVLIRVDRNFIYMIATNEALTRNL